jgi:hypothetical protein
MAGISQMIVFGNLVHFFSIWEECAASIFRVTEYGSG